LIRPACPQAIEFRRLRSSDRARQVGPTSTTLSRIGIEGGAVDQINQPVGKQLPDRRCMQQSIRHARRDGRTQNAAPAASDRQVHNLLRMDVPKKDAHSRPGSFLNRMTGSGATVRPA
jgi:hypothetical protein